MHGLPHLRCWHLLRPHIQTHKQCAFSVLCGLSERASCCMHPVPTAWYSCTAGLASA
ncbi:hypothetical protein F751_3557 [Auxenochlorella protothecoides]|uniref:Uncharacterized protein n=1 Tax=Auxenochlorella protothecoides TaxID=3075 RepID=A0A087SSM3_AUXPR|nr:hypothetical protein F751_3557 [Auxenochlorella protothecoides]KFM28727.1 hypothetical protein F751_3557 [Auxenochlorella protothecoides]